MTSACALRSTERCTPWENIRGLIHIRINLLHTTCNPHRISRNHASSHNGSNYIPEQRYFLRNASASMLKCEARRSRGSTMKILNFTEYAKYPQNQPLFHLSHHHTYSLLEHLRLLDMVIQSSI